MWCICVQSPHYLSTCKAHSVLSKDAAQTDDTQILSIVTSFEDTLYKSEGVGGVRKKG